MGNQILPPPRPADSYRGLPRLIHFVRWGQHVLAVVAEILILLSFAMSGMDVSLGGVMASIPLLKVLWAGMFALGIDTAFVLSWVRVRQSTVNRNWLALAWNVVLALGMSVILFQPVAIQLAQQSLGIDFAHAVESLGINIVFLTYARAAVAVFLGAILAMTNVESAPVEVLQAPPAKRRIVLFHGLLNRIAPVVEELPAPQPTTSDAGDITKTPTLELPTVSTPVPAPVVRTDTSPEERQARVRGLALGNLSPAERVAKILNLFPDVPDRELGRLSGVSAATAKKYRPSR